jgi:hypothetical protein
MKVDGGRKINFFNATEEGAICDQYRAIPAISGQWTVDQWQMADGRWQMADVLRACYVLRAIVRIQNSALRVAGSGRYVERRT